MERFDSRVFRWAFDAAVPAEIVIGAVAVLLSNALVVLDVIRDEIVEGETVVAGHEIDAPFQPPPFDAKDIGAGYEPVWEFVAGAVVALHEVADSIAKLPVPLLPGMADEAADLIVAWTFSPCL